MAVDQHLTVAPQKPGLRRFSSMTATREEMESAGPFTIVPPSKADRPAESHETAAAMELAKRHLAEALQEDQGAGTPPSPSPTDVTDSYAYAFDIDGVLVKGGEVIPQAIEAMRVLNGENEYRIKVPYIFVTNGGGKTEAERCLQLSRQLELEISPGQFICGHTPMREMAEKYKTVLVIGGEGDKCRKVAEGYGFADVVTPGDIILDNRNTTPFRQLTAAEEAHSRRRNMNETELEAIFVFADSRDWAGDQQIILDVLMSVDGRLGTRSRDFARHPPIYFSHNDIVWSTSHDYTRLGMGALRASVEALYKAVTGLELKSIAFGKPQIATFEFATRLLQQWRKETHGINSPPETVYFVGDTPESDIRGTNEYNESDRSTAHWYSILVETGVYDRGTTPNYRPRATVPTVLEAVRHGIHREAERQRALGRPVVSVQQPQLSLGPADGELREAALKILHGSKLDGQAVVA